MVFMANFGLILSQYCMNNGKIRGWTLLLGPQKAG